MGRTKRASSSLGAAKPACGTGKSVVGAPRLSRLGLKSTRLLILVLLLVHQVRASTTTTTASTTTTTTIEPTASTSSELIEQAPPPSLVPAPGDQRPDASDEPQTKSSASVDGEPTSESPGTLATTSAFDELVLGAAGHESATGADIDYILASSPPTTSAPGEPRASVADEVRQSEESRRETDGQRHQVTELVSAISEPAALASQAERPKAMLAPDARTNSTGEPGQLVRSRKSPENGTRAELEEAARAEAPSRAQVSHLEGHRSAAGASNGSEPARAAREQQAASSSLDYDDFDLDYQLKLNATEPAAGQQQLGLNKRDYDNAQTPAWSALVAQQSHVFAPSANTSGAQHQFYHNTPPIMPSLLTVKSTQLTSQELNRIRPQFLLYHDQYNEFGSNSYAASEPANGDLLATATGGNQQQLMGAASVLAPNGSAGAEPASQQANSSQHGQLITISLLNGSPVVRQNILAAQQQQQREHAPAKFGRPATPTDPHATEVTTIVVDNSTPTEPPATRAPTQTPTPMAGASPAPPTGTNNLTTNSSQSHQWFNYPHPNLHQNPLLLHHILNKPQTFYVGNSQHSQPITEPTGPAASSSTTVLPPILTTGPSGIGALPHLVTTGATTVHQHRPGAMEQPSNIIERPTLSVFQVDQQPINKTLVQMQLNELRALDLSNKRQASQQRGGAHQDEHASHLVGSRIQVASQVPRQQPTTVDGNWPQLARAEHRPAANLNALHHLIGGAGAGGMSASLAAHQSPYFRQHQNFHSQLHPRPTVSGLQTSLFIPTRPPASQLITAPSLLQEVYTPRPAASQQQAPNQTGAWPGEAKTQLSDEDMSTYVALLASLNAQMAPATGAGQHVDQPNNAQTSQGPSNLADESSEEQQLVALLKLMSKSLQRPVAAASARPEPDLGWTASNGLQPKYQLDHNSTQAQSWLELLRGAKLIGLSDEVQAQIYRDHLAPLVAASAIVHQAANSTSGARIQQLATSGWPHRRPNSPMESSIPLRSYATMLPNEKSIHSPEARQRDSKGERELQMMNSSQRQKQVAFIEALHSSVARLQASQQLASLPDQLIGHNGSLAMIALDKQLQSDGDSMGAPDEPDGQQQLNGSSSRTPPNSIDWLEKQIIQDSFVHESARLPPFATIRQNLFARPDRIVPIYPTARLPVGRLSPIYPLVPAPARPLRPLAPPTLLGDSSRQGPILVPMHSQPVGQQQHQQPLAQFGAAPPAGVTPTKIMLDRFPLATAPAYLVKLPTLTGGTITASGSLVPPSARFMRTQRPTSLIGAPAIGPLRFLSAIAPPRMRLPPPPVPGLVHPLLPAPSILRVHHQAPLVHHHQHLQTLASLYQPVHQYHPAAHLYPATRTQTYASLHQPAVESSNLDPMSHAAAPAHHGPGEPAPPATNPPSTTGAGAQPASLQQTVAASPSASMSLGQAAGYANAQQMGAGYATGAGQSHAPDQAAPPGAGSAGSAASAALSRLQQATASLVELTSLASLVEEMVGGSDIESSPAIALANALSSISAAQSAALNAQASQTSGATTPTGADQPQAAANGAPQQAPFSWKSLFAAGLWRHNDKLAGGQAPAGAKLRDLSALERFLAHASSRPPARLKVKYIRVPVAVYETSATGGGGGGGGLALVPAGRNHLVTKTQLAEIVAQPGASGGLQQQHQQLANEMPIGGAAPAGATSAASGGVSSSSGGAGSSPAAAPSANDYLFDEMSSESGPQLHYLLQPDDGAEHSTGGMAPLGFLPIVRAARPAAGARGRPPGELMGPLESGPFYSLAGSPSSPSSSAASGGVAASASGPDQDGRPTTKAAKKKRRKKKNHDDDDTDDDDDDEDDDDDLLSSKDLPVLESIISALVQGPAAGQQVATGAGPPAASGWRPRTPFAGLRGLASEGTTNVATYAPAPNHHLSAPPTASSPISSFARYRFGLGELVGALGARKLIASLLGKRERSRTSKRAANHTPVGSLNPVTRSPINNERTRTNTLKTTTDKVSSHWPMTLATGKRVVSQSFGTSRNTKQTVKFGPAKPAINFPSIAAYADSPGRPKKVTPTRKPVARPPPRTTTPTSRSGSSSSNVIGEFNYDENTNNKTLNETGHQTDSAKSPVSASNGQVQFNFFLKTTTDQPNHHQQQAATGAFRARNNTDVTEGLTSHKMAMPLYHVVADHYNKLNAGHIAPPAGGLAKSGQHLSEHYNKQKQHHHHHQITNSERPKLAI